MSISHACNECATYTRTVHRHHIDRQTRTKGNRFTPAMCNSIHYIVIRYADFFLLLVFGFSAGSGPPFVSACVCLCMLVCSVSPAGPIQLFCVASHFTLQQQRFTEEKKITIIARCHSAMAHGGCAAVAVVNIGVVERRCLDCCQTNAAHLDSCSSLAVRLGHHYMALTLL